MVSHNVAAPKFMPHHMAWVNYRPARPEHATRIVQPSSKPFPAADLRG